MKKAKVSNSKSRHKVKWLIEYLCSLLIQLAPSYKVNPFSISWWILNYSLLFLTVDNSLHTHFFGLCLIVYNFLGIFTSSLTVFDDFKNFARTIWTVFYFFHDFLYFLSFFIVFLWLFYFLMIFWWFFYTVFSTSN